MLTSLTKDWLCPSLNFIGRKVRSLCSPVSGIFHVSLLLGVILAGVGSSCWRFGTTGWLPVLLCRGIWTSSRSCLLRTLTFLTPSDSTWVLGVRKWMLSTMTQTTTTTVTSTMPKSRNLRAHTQPRAPREWHGRGTEGGMCWGVVVGWASTHLPMRGMAMDVGGSRLEMSSRKTDWAKSTAMAIDVFSPPGGAWT